MKQNSIVEEKFTDNEINISYEGSTGDEKCIDRGEFTSEKNISDETLMNDEKCADDEQFSNGKENITHEKPSSIFSNTFKQLCFYKLGGLVLLVSIVLLLVNRK